MVVDDLDKLKNFIKNSSQLSLDERTILLAIIDNLATSNTWGAIEW